MPYIQRQPGKAGRLTRIDKERLTAMATGVWLTPKQMDISSSFKPTQKSQSKEFSCEQPYDRPPTFNATKLKKRFKEPLYIGVRSPYALVDLLIAKDGSEKIIDWDEISKTEANNMLVQYLGFTTSNSLLRYEQLFDPKHGSRLFSRSIKQIQKQIQMGIPENIANYGIQTGAGSPTRVCGNAKKWMDPDPTIPWIYSSVQKVGHTPYFDAVRQGAADDCWFIAALCSMAWVFPGTLNNIDEHAIFILNPNSDLEGQELLEASYTDPGTALPYQLDASSDSYFFWWSRSKYPERWIAVMEKAFAKQIMNTGTANPNVCDIPRGDPQYALYVLLGDKNWERYWNITQDNQDPVWQNEDGTTTYTADTLFNHLWNNCCNSATNKRFRMTNNPSVAFTFYSDAAAPKSPGNVDPAVYSSDLLIASHSYSVLGVYIEENKKYIVLMNPWGIIKDVTYATRDTIPGVSTGFLAKGPLSGFYDGVIPRDLWIGYNENTGEYNPGNVKDGVFALDLNTFARYFWGLSWA